MSGSETPSEREYGETQVNDRGRLTIPKALRDDLQIEGGTRFTVLRDGRDIRLVRKLPDLTTVTAGRTRGDWRGVAFRDTGDATFGNG